MKKVLLISVILLIIKTGSGQSPLPRFADPVRLDAKINTDAEESMPVLTSDGGTMYFVRTFYNRNNGGKEAGQDIWRSSGSKSAWAEADNNVFNLNNNNNNAVVGVSRDGKRLYLLNQYVWKDKMKAGISVYEPGKTESPVPLDIPGLDQQSDFYGFYMHPDENILLISAKLENSLGEEDLYVSLKINDKWSSPVHLGSTVNTGNYDISPFLSDDTKTLYFATAGRGGLGSADIFMSTRLDDTWKKWAPPVNLGNKINSRGFDAYYFMQGNNIWFSSNRSSEMSDIYFTRIMSKEELEAMLPKPLTIYFKLNSYMISGESKPVMEEVVKILEQNQELKVIITGYTCSIGNENQNQKLSEMRAGSAMDFLLAYGIGVDRIEIGAVGESKADLADQSEEVQKMFRKVEIRFDYLY